MQSSGGRGNDFMTVNGKRTNKQGWEEELPCAGEPQAFGVVAGNGLFASGGAPRNALRAFRDIFRSLTL